MGPAGNSVGDFVRMAGQIEPASKGLAEALREPIDKITQVGDKAATADAQLRGLMNAELEAAGSALGVSAAQRDFNKALEDGKATRDDAKSSADDIAASYDEETQRAIDVASATVNYAEKQAAAEGHTLSASAANDIMIGTLSSLVGQTDGPTRASLLGLIAHLQEVGRQHPTPTVGVIDQITSPVNAVQTKLDVLGRTRATAAIHADDQTAAAFAAANARGNAWNGKVFTAIATLVNTVTGRPPGKATGGAASGPTWVAESGPELVDLPPGSYVHSAEETKALRGGGAPSTVIINMPAGTDPAAVVSAQQRWTRRNGSR